MDSDLIKCRYLIYMYALISVSGTTTTTTAYENCNSSVDCPKGYFCNFRNRNNNEIEWAVCTPCLNCTFYNRQSVTSECVTLINQCGSCLSGYNITKRNVISCNLVDATHNLLLNEPSLQLLPTASTIQTNEIITAVATVIPVSIILLIALTLLLSRLYEKQIRNNVTKNNRYFDYEKGIVIT